MNVALIGCGRIGREHAAAVHALGRHVKLSFCDPDPEAAGRVAGLDRGRAYTEIDACLEAERPAVVHVCTPPATHGSLVVRALESGAAVLVEKPLALSLRETTIIARALRDRPGALCIDHNFLFEPCVVTARRWTSEGRIGRLFAADVFYGVDPMPGDAGPGTWAGALPGGRFTDLLPHPLYLARHFLGDVRHVAACDAEGSVGRTELGVTLACERGLAGIRVSLVSTPWELGLVLRGEEGTIRVDFARQRAVLVRAPRGGGRRLSQLRIATATAAQTASGAVERVAGKVTGRLRGYPGMRALVAAFHRSVRDGLPPPVPFEDGAAVVSAIEAIHAALDAARGGRAFG